MFRKLCILGAIASIMTAVAAAPKKKKKAETNQEAEDAKMRSTDNNNPVLHPMSGGRYKIMQFTDLHLGEDDVADQLTLGFITNALNTERPNLAVFTGDIVSGAFFH